MRHDSHAPKPVQIDPNATYEVSDVDLNSLPRYLFALFFFVGLTALITYFLFYRPYLAADDVRTSQYPIPTMRTLPAGPILQANPTEDIVTMRRNEDISLHSYGRDTATGALHIPVDRALDLVAKEGLPTRAHPGKIDRNEPNEPSRAEGQAPPEGEVQTMDGTAVSTVPLSSSQPTGDTGGVMKVGHVPANGSNP